MTKLVAFDLDGTLNMTHTYAVAAYQEALKELGAGPVAESVIRSRFGAPFRDDSLFFLGDAAGPGRSALAAAVFLGVIVFCVAMTLAMSKLLSATVLRGQPSFFSLEQCIISFSVISSSSSSLDII